MPCSEAPLATLTPFATAEENRLLILRNAATAASFAPVNASLNVDLTSSHSSFNAAFRDDAVTSAFMSAPRRRAGKVITVERRLLRISMVLETAVRTLAMAVLTDRRADATTPCVADSAPVTCWYNAVSLSVSASPRGSTASSGTWLIAFKKAPTSIGRRNSSAATH